MSDVQIIVREGQGYLVGAPMEVEAPLAEATSFRPLGYQYDWRFKQNKWDGYVRLYKGGKFPAGLLKNITVVLEKNKVPYQLHVDTVSQEGKPELQSVVVGVESRPYQDAAVEAALLNPRGVIQGPTGSGKTAIGVRIIHARRKHALVIVPTIDLLYQYMRFITEHLEYGQKVGQLGDGIVDPRPVTVGTARTVAKALGVSYQAFQPEPYNDRDETEVTPGQLKGFFNDVGTLIVDECHILGAQEIFNISNKIPAPNKYGMSASPWRDDGADLQITAACGPVIYRIKTDELVADGFLVPPIIQVVSTIGQWPAGAWGQICQKCRESRDRKPPPQWGYVDRCTNCGSTSFQSEYQQAYKKEIVENSVRNLIVTKRTLAAPAPRLVLVRMVRHGKLLNQLIPNSLFLSGKNPSDERNEAYERMRDGEIDTIIATTIADMGLDLPILRSLVLAGGGKSSVRHLQRMGRVARPYEGKKAATIIDFDDGWVHKWFREHEAARRKIERAEWGGTAVWI